MPLPSRDFAPVTAEGEAERARALEVLLDPSLAHVLDLVAWRAEDGLHVASSTGHSRYDGTVSVLSGQDPVGDPAAYPFAWERLGSLFEDPRAPDLAVCHTDAHHWPERGGHLGEHGSLGAVQSRAPLVLAGAGVAARGLLDRTCRTVDVGATLARLAGGSVDGMEGTPLDLAVPTGAPVVGLLWDGAPSAAVQGLPNVSRLMERGCALIGGAIAEFPSVTLVNHTCALTGVGPGRHGIVNNAYFDRETGEQVVPNSKDTWDRSMSFLRPGVTTVFQRVPGRTACVNDPVDVGADYSTFDLIRSGGGASAMLATLGDPTADPHASQAFLSNPDYAWGSQVDAAGLTQVLELWSSGEPPAFTWWNTTLTDAAHHAGGPGSDIAAAGLRDADDRLGLWLDVVESRGLDVTVLLTADHGMAMADPSCTGDWDEALRAAGIAFRDEAYGFVYLGVT